MPIDYVPVSLNFNQKSEYVRFCINFHTNFILQFGDTKIGEKLDNQCIDFYLFRIKRILLQLKLNDKVFTLKLSILS